MESSDGKLFLKEERQCVPYAEISQALIIIQFCSSNHAFLRINRSDFGDCLTMTVELGLE